VAGKQFAADANIKQSCHFLAAQISSTPGPAVSQWENA
jgi:hypothetical protein